MVRYSDGSEYQVKQRMLGLHPGKRKQWSNHEIDFVLDLWFTGVPIRNIALSLKRTERSVEVMLSKFFSPNRFRYAFVKKYTPTEGRKQYKKPEITRRERWAYERLIQFLPEDQVLKILGRDKMLPMKEVEQITLF